MQLKYSTPAAVILKHHALSHRRLLKTRPHNHPARSTARPHSTSHLPFIAHQSIHPTSPPNHPPHRHTRPPPTYSPTTPDETRMALTHRNIYNTPGVLTPFKREADGLWEQSWERVPNDISYTVHWTDSWNKL